MTTETFVTWNAWVGQGNKPDQLRKNLSRLAKDADYPLAIACQEMKLFPGTFPGYQRIDVSSVRGGRFKRGDDAFSSVLFVRRKGVTFVKPRIIEVGGPSWTGPKHGIVHPPRIFVGATIESDDQRWDLMDVHRTWRYGIKKNAGAWAAEDKALYRWTFGRDERHEGRPVLLLGDWNCGLQARGPLSVRDLAADFDAQALIPNKRPAIDGGLLINCTGKATKLDGLYGSDGHRPVVIEARA